MSKKISLNGPGTIKFEFNLKTMVGMSKIPQEKLIDYLGHDNYKLGERVMEFRSMEIPSDPGTLGLLNMKTPHLAVELVGGNKGSMIFPLEESFPQGHKVIAVYHDQVLIFYKQVSSDEHETCFVAEFVYWDDKYLPIDGLNLKTMVNVSRLDRSQLLKYLDHPNYKLRNNPATIMNLSISENIHRTDGRITQVMEDGDKPLAIHLVCDGFVADRTVASSQNDDVLIIYDKEGKSPQYIYWED